MSFGKTLGGALLIYIISNFIFLLAFIGLGGIEGTDIGALFGNIGKDIFGFLAVLFGPGGGVVGGSVPTTFMYFLNDLLADTPVNKTAANVIGLLWVLLPGLLASLVAGMKFADDSSKTAFFGVFIAILICTLIPMILGAAGLMKSDAGLNNQISTALVNSIFFPSTGFTTIVYLGDIMIGVFNGLLFAGFGAMVSNNL
jgi:hypothetical protein